LGAALEQQIRERLQGSSLRVLGANSIGIVCSHTGFSATFAPVLGPGQKVRPGSVGFLSQSGALLTALLGQEDALRIGCSTFISVGSLLDISWAEWLNYLADDPRTECLGIYMEHLDHAPSFFSAMRQVAPRKPVILIKASGHSSPGPENQAEDEIFEEAC